MGVARIYAARFEWDWQAEEAAAARMPYTDQNR